MTPFDVGAVALWVITTYCPSRECGAESHGITASGVVAVEGVTVACPPELPFTTILEIDGVGFRMCEDRGRAIRGRRLDLFIGSLDETPDRGRRRALRWHADQPREHRVRIAWRPDQQLELPPMVEPSCPGER